MTVAEAITKSGITPSASYTGIETADDFVFAIQTESTQSKETDWGGLRRPRQGSTAVRWNATTNSDTFIRTGPTDTKSAVQRTLSVNGNRCVGDAFQDFLLSRKIVFGTGSDVIVPYIYFSLRTGKGEKGSCSLVVTSDVGGAAGSPATFACDVKGIGIPAEFNYITAAAG